MNRAILTKIVLTHMLLFASIVSAHEEKHEEHGHHDAHEKEEEHAGHRHHDAHEHGRASLNILLDDKTVNVELATPALNVLGFEHAPKTDEQEAKVREAGQVLSRYDSVLTFPGAKCTQSDSYMELPFDEHDFDDEHAHDEKDSHSDYYVTYSVTCDRADKLKQIEVQLFKQFPGFENIDIQWASNSSSGSLTATSGQNKFNLE